MCSSGGQTLEPENIMWKDQKNRHGKWYSGGSSWGKQRRQRGRRPGHRTKYSAHVFNVKTSPAGSCSIFPQSTWAPCPKRWDFLCIQVTGCLCSCRAGRWQRTNQNRGKRQRTNQNWGKRQQALFGTGPNLPTTLRTFLPLAHDSCWQGFNNWTFQSLFESSAS